MLSISACSVLIFESAFCKAINCDNSAFTLYRLLRYLGLLMMTFIETIITQREGEAQGGAHRQTYYSLDSKINGVLYGSPEYEISQQTHQGNLSSAGDHRGFANGEGADSIPDSSTDPAAKRHLYRGGEDKA